jgi:hypothetical protein
MFVWLLTFFAVAQCVTPSLEELTKYTVYSYASSCRVGLPDWSCYWCKKLPPSAVPPVKVTIVFESDGVYGTYGYVGYSATVRIFFLVREEKGKSVERAWGKICVRSE